MAAIIGTWISIMFSRTFVPSRRILSYPVGVKKSKPSGEIWAQNSLPIPVRIIADVAERPNQRFVYVTVEYQRTASRMQSDLQDSILPLHFQVAVFISVAIEHSHAPFLTSGKAAAPAGPDCS